MTATTPTGIPILPCEQCGGIHPITRTHCSECGSSALFCHPSAPRVPAWEKVSAA